MTKEPRALSLDDPVVDEAEARLLRELGFGALLMTALELGDEVWGLVEVYRSSRRPFTRGGDPPGGRAQPPGLTTSAEQLCTSALRGSATPSSCGCAVSISI